ncbi:restriction endonuclease [Aneurinibacillus danicus]|jgi:hypothetical protein|uniref:Restriction endonuclease n=1 Tax=Aneurinibacillus danicus TaxID=267746 RepID=A0A511VAT9_9BACL|nr:restriction endonuclease [Aneurinibacillus danicus]GEN35028.1 hypothetical protein ADA01nite_24880 [Aneurinibacillus danicus]
MNRGYAGYYGDVYLRSSYEYAYAKYLDYKQINWKYEEKKFDLGDKMYTPDFFIYNEKSELQFIVEIKSRNQQAKIKALENLEKLKMIFDIEYKLVSYQDLLLLYKELPFSLTGTIAEWNTASYTTINKSTRGSLNPHYSHRHTKETKKTIGLNTKKLWNNPDTRKKMIAGSIKGAAILKARKGKFIRVLRVERKCNFCGQAFVALETSRQKFCSDICGGRYGFQLATEVYVSKRNEIRGLIKKHVLEWSRENRELILNTPFNRIKTTLSPLLAEIQSKYGVKDIRVITQAVLGEQLGRKDLLAFLKENCNT